MTSKKAGISDEEIIEAYERLGSLRLAAEYLGVGKDTVSRRLKKAGINTGATKLPVGKKIEDSTSGSERVLVGKGVRSLEDLLERAGVDPEDWIVSKHSVNAWEAFAGRGESGDPETVTLHQVKAWLERRPSFWAKRVECNPIRRHPTKGDIDVKTCLIVPDSQHGFRRHEDGSLEPLHDRKACDVVIQACRLLQPTTIVLLGDMLDLAPWGSYSTDLSLRWTTQPSLVELHWFISQLRLASPSARIVYLEGNHEYRIQRVLTDAAAGEAVNLRPADSLDGNAVMSIPHLLSLDKLDVEYVAPYGKPFWWEGVRFHHGSLVRSRGGQTVTAMLGQGHAHSQVVGHIHRREVASRTIPTAEEPGRKTISALSPGCLCRVDDAVPHKAGTSQLDWQHGLGIAYATSSGTSLHLVPIDDGEAVVNGRVLVGEDRVQELRRATGMKF